MTDNPEPIFSNDLLVVLSKALSLPYAQRIVIDVQFRSTVKVYIQAVADERLLKIDWAGELKDSQIIAVAGEAPQA